MKNARMTSFWHKIDGPLGALFIIIAAGMTGYVLRGYEDGGIVATLLERVRSASRDARADERNQCATKVTSLNDDYRERARLRDNQVATLVQQNKVLLGLVNKSIADQSTQLRKANEAASAAAKAAEVASNTNEKVTEVSKKIDSAASAVKAEPASGIRSWFGGGRSR